MDFKTILYRLSESEETAFRELFDFFFPGLTSYATSLLKNQQMAEEVVEDVFVTLWKNRASAVNIQRISTYLYKAVKYASINMQERQKKFKSVSFDEIGETFTFSYLPEDNSVINKENCRKISEAINRLPTKCQLIFRLIKEDGMKYRDVAELLGLSEKTVENQMNIAIKKLIEALKADFPEFRLYFS